MPKGSWATVAGQCNLGNLIAPYSQLITHNIIYLRRRHAQYITANNELLKESEREKARERGREGESSALM